MTITACRIAIRYQIDYVTDDTPEETQGETGSSNNVSASAATNHECLIIPSREPSPMIISSDSEKEAAPAVPNEVERSISPALSYLTLDEMAPGTEAYSVAQPVVEPSQRRKWNYESESDENETSDEDSSMDEEHNVHPLPLMREEPSEMDLIVGRLLAGEESRVEKILKDMPLEQRRRVQECMTSTVTSHSRGRANADSSCESDSSDSSSSEDESEDEPQIINRSKKRRHSRNSIPRVSGREVSRTRTEATPSSMAEDDGITVILPKAHRARGRRLIVPQNRRLPIAAVYMRGDVQFIKQNREGVR